jgi:quercetin dioxygenase-like cupin family protein
MAIEKKPIAHEAEIQLKKTNPSVTGGVVLNSANGCTNGARMGISYYSDEKYQTCGVHDDQELFYVLDGTGFVLLGEKEYPITVGSVFVATPGTPHSIRRNEDSPPIKILWFHGAP